MSFKDFMQNFLYEESGDDDEDDVVEEPVQTSEPEAKPQPQPEANPAAPSYISADPIPAMIDQTIHPTQAESLLSQEIAADQGNSFLSRIDESMESEETAPTPASRTRTPKRSAKTKRPAAREEYTAVISPIFGNLPEDKKDTRALHDAINLPKPVESIDMVEVISPMFGQPHKSEKKSPVRVKKAAPSQEAHHTDLPATEAELAGFEEAPNPTDLADYLLSSKKLASNQNSRQNGRPHKKGSRK